MYLVMLPSQTLRNAETTPLIFVQQLERVCFLVKIVFRNELEHLFGQDDVSKGELVASDQNMVDPNLYSYVSSE